jgi:hypothetical protein
LFAALAVGFARFPTIFFTGGSNPLRDKSAPTKANFSLAAKLLKMRGRLTSVTLKNVIEVSKIL